MSHLDFIFLLWMASLPCSPPSWKPGSPQNCLFLISSHFFPFFIWDNQCYWFIFVLLAHGRDSGVYRSAWHAVDSVWWAAETSNEEHQPSDKKQLRVRTGTAPLIGVVDCWRPSASRELWPKTHQVLAAPVLSSVLIPLTPLPSTHLPPSSHPTTVLPASNLPGATWIDTSSPVVEGSDCMCGDTAIQCQEILFLFPSIHQKETPTAVAPHQHFLDNTTS